MTRSTGRRRFLNQSIAAGGLISLPSLLQGSSHSQNTKKKIVVVGGHPDDPECGAGGTIPHLISAGHEVTVMYFTNGDAGISGKTHEQAAAIRRKEALEACKVLGAKPLFVNQVDGASVITNSELDRFQKLLWAEEPNVVFTHWPLDSHKDHQLAGVMTIQSWMEAPKIFELYFYEVCTGNQTFVFHPTDYVDITDTWHIKMKALACHASQNLTGPDGNWSQGMVDCGHPSMEDFRGKNIGARVAEAFIRMTGKGMGKLMI